MSRYTLKKRKLLLAVVVAFVGVGPAGFAVEPASDGVEQPHAAPADGAASRQLAAVDATAVPVRPDQREKPSEAEYIARLERAIKADHDQLEALTCQQDDPQGDYLQSETEFGRLDGQRAELLAQIQELRRLDKGDEAAELEAKLEPLESAWQAAKERFDLAIQVRKALREKITTLQEKLRKDTQALEALTRPPEAEPVKDVSPAPEPKPAARPAAPRESTSPDSSLSTMTPAGVVDAVEQAAAKMDAKPESEELLRARKEAEAKLAAARKADEKARSATERLEALQKNIAVEQQLLELARAKADQAQHAWAALNREFQPKLAENPGGLNELTKKIDEAAERFASAKKESRAAQQRLDDLRTQLAAMQQEKIDALREASDKEAEAIAAQQEADALENPFTLRNMTGWLVKYGPKLLPILLGTLVIYFAVRFSGRHLAIVLARSGTRGTLHERQNRAVTLVGVFRNIASITVIAVGVLMALDAVEIPIAPLMGGAAVVGLAVAFGAQNLVRDYFGGFMVLLEDQYGINDVVKIGEITGAVEQITLRVTTLRDLEGVVHFIPHGTITTVSNMTHGWSRALLDIGVAYKEDTDRVMDIMLDVARELRKDAVFGPLILGDAEMLGVDGFGDSAVVIKMCIKTQPLKRWAVKRELLRRIKHKFDELGIEIPFPHRTLFLHKVEDESRASLLQNGRQAA